MQEELRQTNITDLYTKNFPDRLADGWLRDKGRLMREGVGNKEKKPLQDKSG